MRRYYTRLRALGLLLLLPWLTYGCIDENTDDCPDPQDALLEFVFVPRGANDIDPADVTALSVFVFNASGLYAGQYQDANPRLQDATYRMALTLEPGEYSFVAWGNTGGTTGYSYLPDPLAEGVTHITDAKMVFDRPANDTVAHTIGHLFHGILARATLNGKGEQTLTVPMVQNTYTINLEVAGLDATAGKCRAVITDNHNSYEFDNDPIAAGDMHYFASCATGGTTQHTSLRTLRLTTLSTTRLRLYDATGTLRYDALLTDLIRAANGAGASLDFDSTHTFDIRVLFDVTYGTFTVTINGWNADSQDHNISPQS